MINNYFKIAWRNLWQHRGTSALNIGGLAIALAASILILLWVQNELRYDNYHNDAERIHLLVQYDTARAEYWSESSPFPTYAAIKEAVPEAELLAMAQPTQWGGHLFEVNGRPFEEKNALFVDSNWTRMFNYKVLHGSLDDFTAASNKIVISRSKAKQYFGSLPPLEQTVFIDSVPCAIAAVVEDAPANTSFQQEVLIPNAILLRNEATRRNLDWGFYSHLLFVKLSPNTAVHKAEEKITNVFWTNQTWSEVSTNYSRLIPLPTLHFMQSLKDSIINHGNPQNVKIFTLLAVLLLITAGINFVNLSIARIGLRLKEIGVRKIVGAARQQLFGQVMVETTLFVALSMAFGLLLVALALPAFNAFTEKHFVLHLLAEGPVILLLAGVFVFVLLLTGLYPALLLATQQPIGLLRQRGVMGAGRQGLRKVLVTAQLTMAVVMLVGIITIYRQFAFIQQQAAGYQKEQVFKIHAPSSDEPIRMNDQEAVKRRVNTLNDFKTRLLSSSAIQAVSRVNGVSVLNDNRREPSRIVWTGYPEQAEQPEVVPIWIDEDYDEIANLTLVSGRWFDAGNVSDRNNIVLNETAVKTFELKEPVVGTTYSNGMYGGSGTVIGVVKDFHHQSLHEKINPVILCMDPFILGPSYLVKAHAGTVKQALDHTQSVWETHYPGHPFTCVFLDEEFDKLYKDDRKALTFSIVFGSLSTLISCFGLLGMVMVAAQQRTKEIGIRKVLGASVAAIGGLLSKDFVRLVFLAIVIASPIAWWVMNAWLEDFAYRIDIEWWMFAGAGLAALVIALLTVSGQAIRAAVANPVESLRDE